MSFRERQKNGVVWEEAGGIPVRHAFTTRFGGVSRGIWASLNLGTSRGDDPACVAENYRRLAEAVGLDLGRLCFTRQVHRTEVRAVTSADALPVFGRIPYEADGIVTNEPGVSLICFTADCVPILLYDPGSGAVGAVHAGWKGTGGDIAGEAIRVMSARYGTRPQDLRAAVGPHIGACCYETGPEVAEVMAGLLGSAAEAYCRPDGEKFFVDLGGINRELLLRAGLAPEHIDLSQECTMCLHERYWSHRYTRGQRGVQAAVIMREAGGTTCGE